ncbi:hypothetical protein TREMEDRAFT_30643 [Tremella mesenterica DSM 1558]|uniref:uncharacterized protein n=1 Tax=Tremella mesenterica (strain ATCC 24925 / CBS 8224 / DSM 1558 / NBRC 9311 / NRRL Y-6157 / RJB 2259-6 / UBC 559-6) TaxID=578456 RepID=UPI0003F4A405|nr:uncharacterized protein TREMEDRAFT_30643 [Tremella mesenterica DSM 1558]EIW69628.1 hypothetical protein TREMEDRAFT_30643 [Tremella mesenterica DSM 1558]
MSTRPALSTGRKIAISGIVTFTTAMSAAGQMGLTIALPKIQTELNMLATDLQWIQSAYTLTNGCFLLLSGRIADVYGRKLVFIVGVAWYAIWCLIGGFMKNGVGLIITRALAGVGAAISTPSAIGIIAANFEGRARSTAFASFSAGAPIGAGFGLVLGGVCTAFAPTTWRACLWCLAGISVPPVVLGWFFIPPDHILPTGKDRSIDWVGATMVTCGLVLLQFVLTDGLSAPHGWRTGYIIALLILGVALIVAFFFWEQYVVTRTSKPPLTSPKLWTRASGKLASVYFIGFATWMCFASLFYHATLFYQQVQDLSPIGAMLRFLPCPISGVLCNIIVAGLIASVRTQWIVCVGTLSTGIASILFALAPPGGIYWAYPFNGMWSCVLGADFLMATGSIFVSALSLQSEQSVAGALFQTLVQLGGSFGLAFTTLINQSIYDDRISSGISESLALLDGLRVAFWLGAAFCFLAFLVAAIMLRGMGKIGKGVKRKHDKEGKLGEGDHDRYVESKSRMDESETSDVNGLEAVGDEKNRGNKQ